MRNKIDKHLQKILIMKMFYENKNKSLETLAKDPYFLRVRIEYQ